MIMHDLVIVGAGPAGSAAALTALTLRPQLQVLLVDRAAFPRDKTCGDGIGPGGVAVLERLGAERALLGGARIDRLRISTHGGARAAGPIGVAGYVLPRSVFDARLVEAAVTRGATLVHEVVSRVEQRRDEVVVNGHIAARAVIGADGANSRVRRCVGAGSQPHRHNAVALRGYALAPAAPMELDFRLTDQPWPGYAWCFPAGNGEANIGFAAFHGLDGMSRRRLLEALAALIPEVAPRPGTLRGFHLPLSTARPQPAHGRVMLAGDAAALVNPLSGEGIATALLSGALAGACVARHPDEPAAAYARVLGRRLGRHHRHVGVAARVFPFPAVVESAVVAAGRSPRVLADLAELAVGTGVLTPRLVFSLAVEYRRRRRTVPFRPDAGAGVRGGAPVAAARRASP